MKRATRLLSVLGMALAIGMLAVGCDSGDDDDNGGVNVAGVWTVTDSLAQTGTFNLVQNGQAIAGTVTTSDGTTVPLSGTLNGNALSMTATAGALTTRFTATVTGNAMTGSATDSGGDTVTFTAVKR